jgi:Cutinase
MPNVLRRAAVIIAATACTAGVSVSAAHASTTTASAKCNNVPVVYLVHGIEQGPTVSAPQLSRSPELESFVDDMDEDEDAPRFAWQTVAYPAASVFNLVATWDTYMNDGERNLQAEITSWNNRTCAGDRHIALVGYSMGAWVIDKWIIDHKSEWGEVKAVSLFGDPCWTSPKYNAGLTRLYLASYGCPSTKYYPYPAARSSVPFPISSYSLNKDPISGQGFSAHLTVLNLDNQLASALACFDTATCPHLDYQNGQIGADAVESGAGFVVQHLAGLPVAAT